MTEIADTTSEELYSRFAWFNHFFGNAVQAGSDDFLFEGIRFKLLSVSKNLNMILQDESYFVTKVKIDSQNEIYIRNSDKAVNTILTKALGERKNFDINKITELEAKMITAFNDNLYNFMSGAFVQSQQQSRKFDLTNLTFFIKDEQTNSGGKIIISFPGQIVSPEPIVSQEDKFSYDYFNTCFIDVNIKIGTTEFTVGDLKSLEAEDIVVLDNSSTQLMKVDYNGYEKEFRITPNPALIISVDNSEGEEMASPSENLWDSIQVEMGAEFDKVKISLGDLKTIEQGLVVDISSIYDNNVTLKVEDKVIATGELVIVNDRYGVKINKVFAEPKPTQEPEVQQEEIPQEEHLQPEQIQDASQIGEPMGEHTDGQPAANGDEDFDYSDFDLEDEDL